MPYDVLFLVFIASSLLVALLGFLAVLWNRFEWEKARREKYRTRYHYDQLGNPEYYYSPDTGDYYLPPLGNRAYPDNLIIQPGNPRPVPKRSEPEFSVYKIPLEQYALEETYTSAQLPGETSEVEIIRECKSRGIGKTDALREYFGLSGGSKFQRLSKLWDSVQVNKE
jgi:hypothetical protein